MSSPHDAAAAADPARPPAGPSRALYPPLAFHELHRAGDGVAWRGLLGIPVVAVGFFALPLAWLLVVVTAVVLMGGGSFGAVLARAGDLGDPGPLALAYLMSSLALLVPLTWGVTRWLHGLRPRWTTSVGPRMRWGFFALCLGLSLVALLATVVVGALVPAPEAAGAEMSGELNEFTARTRDFLLVVVLLTPLQAAGEEYFFRGYLTQAVGGLLGARVGRAAAIVAAVLVPAVLFALAHGAQDPPIFVDRLAFGIVAGVLVVATGGLEAAIAMHVLNNLLAFGAALAFGDLGSALAPTGGSWWSLPVTLTQSLVYLALALGVARLTGVQRVCDPAVLIASRGRVYGSHPVPHAVA